MISEPSRNGNAKHSVEQTANEPPLSTHDEAILTDPEKQEEYRRLLSEELRRRSCPGCGEEPWSS